MIELISCAPIDQTVKLPGSKYIANRLIPMCALASSPSRLTNIVDNNDIQAAISGLQALGYHLNYHQGQLDIKPRTTHLTDKVVLNTSHSGTFSRFVCALAALDNVPVRIECSDKMATRPMQELFASLRELGVTVESPNQRLPAVITGPMLKHVCQVDAQRSSQFISALLIAGVKLAEGLEIQLVGKGVSNSYVDMTIFWLQQLGAEVTQSRQGYRIEKSQSLHGITTEVPGDSVSASYFMGLTGIAGGNIKIDSFDFNSLQGESKFYHVLEKMGMTFKRQENALLVTSNGPLKAVDVDMAEMPDVVQTLAVMACFAEGTTCIRNIAHLAFKESNRIKDTAEELKKTGIEVSYGDDYLKIVGGTPHGATIETYDDHRMAMSMALLGARTDGIRIQNPEVVNKSFPSYWDQMSSCGLNNKPVS